MPKHQNGVRGGSSKRREITSDQTKDQEFRSPNGLDASHGDTEDPGNPAATLASCNGALQRLAGIARYFESSFNEDISMVERDYGAEMDREDEIQRLRRDVKTLTHAKDERLENLQYENEKLKAGEETCKQERARCQTIRAELEEQHIQAEAEREKEHNRKFQDEKAKLQKSMKVKKAEIEAGSRETIRELENRIENLSTANEKLKQSLSAAEEKLKDKKIKHARVEKSLQEENDNLRVELKQINVDNFRQISDAVEGVASKYFRKLPERAIENPEAVHHELSQLDPIFTSTPIWESEVSEFLRLKNVQHVISTGLCDFIWYPLFPQDDLLDYKGAGQFLEAVSKSLSVSGGRSESAWRVLTLRGIAALDGAEMAERQVESMVDRILKILRPLTTQSQLAELKSTLVDFVKESVKLWTAAQKDDAKVVVEARPDPSDHEKWYAEDIQGLVEASMPLDDKIDPMNLKPLCIFPSIHQITSSGDTVPLHRGSAVFPTSQVYIHGMLEQREHEEELAKAMSDARSKVNARRTLVPTGPNSPTTGRFPRILA
ncbi:MAG: hypothetical protein Q9168_004924 [Polycauliona sp. 1 TL-2023]